VKGGKATRLSAKILAKEVIAKEVMDKKEVVVLNKLLIRSQRCFLYRLCLTVVLTQWFSVFINLCIIGNMIVLSFDRYPISAREDQILEYINYAFFAIFTLELFLKLTAYGFLSYFSDFFNAFDFAIVIVSILDIFISSFLNSRESSGAITAMRTFRLIRIFKLAKSSRNLQNLLSIIGTTLKDVSNFSVLLFIFIYTYTLLGMGLFAYQVKFDSATNEVDLSDFGTYPYSTFNTFQEGLVSVFIVLTNDGWSTIFADHYRAVGPASSCVFFLSLVILGQYVLLNLFISILILNFEQQQMIYEAKTQALL